MRALFPPLGAEVAGFAEAEGLPEVPELPVKHARMRPPKADPYRNHPAPVRKAA